jgi:hypothetical protein
MYLCQETVAGLSPAPLRTINTTLCRFVWWVGLRELLRVILSAVVCRLQLRVAEYVRVEPLCVMCDCQ